MKPPTVRQLLPILHEIEVRIVETAINRGEKVYGHHHEGVATLSLRKARTQSKADTLVTTLIHEAVHEYFLKTYPDVPPRREERATLQWETVLFRSRALREAALIRIVNAAHFGE